MEPSRTLAAPPRATAAAPRAIGSPPAAFRAALEELRRVGARKVLDCPAGKGAFTVQMLAAGLEVTCCEIAPELLAVPGHAADFGDLNDRLPYADDRFDAVVCLNGLQRVWARGRAVRELARVVRPGGHVILTFLNNVNLSHRLTFLATGSVTWNVNGPPDMFLPDAANPAACFRYPMTLANVLGAFEAVGFEPARVRAVGWSKPSIALFPLLPIVWLGRLLAPGRYRRHGFLGASTSLDALFGDYVVVTAKKRG
jgi:SAM-dependent methyltransferase